MTGPVKAQIEYRVLQRPDSPRLLLRIRKGLRRLDPVRRIERQPRPAAFEWGEMLRRLDDEEAERRLSAVEAALNETPRNQPWRDKTGD